MLRSPIAWLLAPSLLVSGALLFGCADPTPTPEEAPADAVDDLVAAAEARLNASEGGRLILRAIDAHGGLAAWYAAPTSSYTWEYANEGSDIQFASFMVVDNRTRQAYHDLLTLGSYGNPQPVNARFAWTGTDAWIWPDSITQINPRFWSSTGYYFEQIPFVLADPGVTYEVLPDAMLDGEPHDLVRAGFEAGVGDAPGDTYTLYLDKDTGQVDAIRYTVTYGRDVDPDAPPSETLLDYEDYVTVDGLTVPTHFIGHRFENGARGAFRNEAWADSISFRRPFDAAQLEPLPGARMAPPPGA